MKYTAMNQQGLFLFIQDTYKKYLINLLNPLVYEGLQSIYNSAVAEANRRNKPDRIFEVFQEMLQGVNEWNRDKLERETNRIKAASNTADHFDDLVYAICKSHIITLSYSDMIVSSPVIQAYFNNFDVVNFIHRCYIECAKEVYNRPFLFYPGATPLETKRNGLFLEDRVERGLERAIIKILPHNTMLKEFLANTSGLFQNINPFPSVKKSMEPVQREIENLILKESKKSEREKVQEIINLDKLLESVKQASVKPNSLERNVLNIKIGSEAPPISPHVPNVRVLEAFGVSETPMRPY